MDQEPVASIQLDDGVMRPIYEEGDEHFVIGDDGKSAYGIWFIPRA